MRRVTYMSIFAFGGMVANFFTDKLADAKIKEQDFEGPYRWNGEEYD